MGQFMPLSTDAEAVYRVLLASPKFGVAEIAEALAWPTSRVTHTLDVLAGLTLVASSAEEPDRVRLVNPEFGLSQLLHQQEEALAEHQREVAAMRLAVAQILTEYDDSPQSDSGDVRRFVGLDAIASQIERLAHNAEISIEVFAPRGAQTSAALESARPLDQRSLDRGLTIRYIYLDSIRNDTATLLYARWLEDAGGAVRTVPHLPLRMIIYDRRTAIVPTNPDAAAQGILVIEGAGVVTALVSLFQQVWESALPISTPARQLDAEELTAQEQAVLKLLLEGHTDDVVARKLGVSVRTGRRVTAQLMIRLGARSRFQAGALAMSRGWLGADL